MTTRPVEGVVKFFLPDKGYGFIIPKDGGQDVYFRHESVRVPLADSSGRFGWAMPSNGSTPRFPRREGGDEVIFVPVNDSRSGKPRANSWAYFEDHARVIEELWTLLALCRFPSN